MKKIDGRMYMQDAHGSLIDASMVKPIDRLRDETVCAVMEKTFAERDRLKKFKSEIWEQIQNFVVDSAKESGAKKMGGTKGNITLTSFDGKYKIMVAINDTIQFSEKLQIAKSLIDKCIEKWSADSRPEIRVLVNDAFKVGKSGVVSTARILGLRRLDIKDSTWKKAMDAITESITVASSKSYLRFYERANDGSYKQIPLDVSVL